MTGSTLLDGLILSVVIPVLGGLIVLGVIMLYYRSKG